MSHLKYYGCLVAFLFLVPWILSSGIQYGLGPSEFNQDAQAYLFLVQAAESENISDIKKYASLSYDLAEDAEICQLAEHLISFAEYLQRAKIKTVSEANSFKGGIKSFLQGAIDPSYGLESAILLVDSFISDPDKLGMQLDEKYGPVFENYVRKEHFAQISGKVSFWLLLIAGVGVYLWKRKNIDSFFRPNSPDTATEKK